MPLALLGQGTFQNLNFEAAIQPLDPQDPNGVPASNAIPSWTFFTSPIYYNTIALGGAGLSLHDMNSLAFQPLQGNYSFFIQGSAAGPPVSAAIGQTGQIPAGSLSLRFWAFPASNLQVTFGGAIIPIFRLASTANYDVFGGDVSMFAGQTAELRFTGLANSGGYFDNIFFSSQSIPEPSALSILGLGAILVGRWFLRKRS